jgi:flagellar basal-body rod modification protein FlgD
MSQVPSTTGSSSSSSSASDKTTKKINELDMDDFLKLMISELQNQDPMNPMDNKDMLAQVSQIRQIGSNDQLTKTLETVLQGQNFSSAANLIGKNIKGIDNNGANVTGIVDRVTVADGVNTLHVGSSELKLSNIGEIDQG